MEESNQNNEVIMNRAVSASIRIGFVLFLIILSFGILRPFITPIVWGIIFAVGIYPLHKRLSNLLKGRKKISATIIVLLGLAIILIPVTLFTTSTIDEVSGVVELAEAGKLEIPPPNESVKEWPIIGASTYNIWSRANQNLNSLIVKYTPQITKVVLAISSAVMGAVGSTFLFIFALIISGVLLLQDVNGQKAASRIFNLLVGEKGEELTNLSILTIRSVVQGVIGIAVIQAMFLSIGLFAIKLPAAGIVSAIILMVAIMQLPLPLIMLPIIIYVFSYANTVPAVIFTIWTAAWCLADNVLKPILLGKGMDVPMLVILLGAMGGMIVGGLVGLFVGAVVLVLAYKIFNALLDDSNNNKLTDEQSFDKNQIKEPEASEMEKGIKKKGNVASLHNS